MLDDEATSTFEKSKVVMDDWPSTLASGRTIVCLVQICYVWVQSCKALYHGEGGPRKLVDTSRSSTSPDHLERLQRITEWSPRDS